MYSNKIINNILGKNSPTKDKNSKNYSQIYSKSNKYVEDRPMGLCHYCRRPYKQRLNIIRHNDMTQDLMCDDCFDKLETY